MIWCVCAAVFTAALFITTNRLADKIKQLKDYLQTGVVTEPEKLSRAMINQKIGAGMFVAGILGFIGSVFLANVTSFPWYILLIVSIALGVFGFIFGAKNQGKVEESLNDDLITKVKPQLEKVLTVGDFRPEDHIENSAVTGERISGSCYCAGQYHGCEAEMSNLKITHTIGSGDDKTTVTDFNGFCVIYTADKAFDESVVMRVESLLKDFEVSRIEALDGRRLLLMLRDMYYFMTQYGPDRVKSNSEVAADVSKVARVLAAVDQALHETPSGEAVAYPGAE